MDTTTQRNGNGPAEANGNIAGRFVTGRWKPKPKKRLGDLEVRVSQMPPGTTANDLNDAVYPILNSFCGHLGLPRPELQIEEDSSLPPNEYEVSLAGATRFAGSFTTDWLDWWAEHPVPGWGGRTGLTTEGKSKGIPPWGPVNQIGRTVEEVLWDDPGLLLVTSGGDNWVTESLSDVRLEPGEAFNGLEVIRELASHRLPLLDRKALAAAIKETRAAPNKVARVEQLISQLLPNKVLVRLGVALEQAASLQDSGSELEQTLLPMMRDGLFYELGIAFGKIEFEKADALAAQGYQIVINQLPRGGGSVGANGVFVNAPPKALEGLDPHPWVNPANGSLGSWIDRGKLAEALGRGNYGSWNQFEFVVLHLSACLREAASEFGDLAWTEQILNKVKAVFPKLAATVRSIYPDERLASVFGRLVSEGFSMRDLPRVLNRLVEFDELANSALVLDEPGFPAEVDWSREDPVALTEYVRGGLKDYVTHAHTRGMSTLDVYLLDSTSLEAQLQRVAQNKSEKEPIYGFQAAGPFLRSLRVALGRARSASQTPTLLTINELRPHLRRLIAAQFPRVSVVSYQELSPDTNIQPLERISL